MMFPLVLSPPSIFEAVYCFICGCQRVTVAQYRMICLVHEQMCSVLHFVGVMRCGPASQRAIKGGLVYLNYDARFIYAEVNGNKVTWLVSV